MAKKKVSKARAKKRPALKKRVTAKAKKRPAKKKAAKKKAKKRAASTRSAEAILLESVQTLRENPAMYDKLRKSLGTAKTDKAKVKALLRYATSERELAALIPPGAKERSVQAAGTTVTVTTVLILASSAY